MLLRVDTPRARIGTIAVTKSQYGGIATSLVALTFAGCTGGDEPAGTYKAADAARLARVAPETPGWPPWPKQPEPMTPSNGESEDEVAARDPISAEYRRRTAEIEQPDGWSSGNRWRDDAKLATLVVEVFETAADAHVGFRASNDLSRAYGAKFGFVAKAENAGGLGDEAGRLWVYGNGRQVTYHWRRGNLVTEVHVHCYGACGPDLDASVDAAARAWAETIDEEARSAGG
jgi:hypothetical protein